MEDLRPYVLVLKSLRDRHRAVLNQNEMVALERAINLMTADLFTEGALGRLSREVNVVSTRVRRSRGQRELGPELERRSRDEEGQDDEDA